MRWRRRMRLTGSMPALAAACALAAPGPLLAGCGGSAPPKPGPTLHTFLTAWSHGDWATMRGVVDAPPADFRAMNAQVFSALGVHQATFNAGPIHTVEAKGKRPETATAEVAAHYKLPQIGSWSPTSTVHLVLRHHAWKVAWSPETIVPALNTGETVGVSRNWPARAPILGAGGTPLTRSATEVTINIVGSRVKDYGAVRADLLAAGATGAEVTQAITQARAHPQDLEPVFVVSLARFEALKAQATSENVYQVPGTQFTTSRQNGAITSQLGAHVVGTVGPVSAAELKKLGSPYDAESVVGQTGIEQSQERTLAGTPTIEINVDDPGGNPIARLATYRGHPGRAVRTSIDPRVQRAAEAALATSTRPNVSMVAIQASTGRVLAIVSDPVTSYDTALQGAYPPGSTFKVIDSTALFRKGMGPGSPADCPPTITVDGESFHNAGNEAATPTITQAFIESCNTAFIGLVTQHLSRPELPSAAGLYGLQGSPHLGLPAFYANVLKASSQTQFAADAIGQGNVTFSTLGMATVAAAIDTGVARAPTLVQGTVADRASKTSKLPAAVVDGLRPMMLGVVESGTAAGTGLPSGTYAKTGTAEYGTGPESSLKIDGWLMGYHGNIAFAIVTQDTGGQDGGPIDGPIIARFFSALGG